MQQNKKGQGYHKFPVQGFVVNSAHGEIFKKSTADYPYKQKSAFGDAVAFFNSAYFIIDGKNRGQYIYKDQVD